MLLHKLIFLIALSTAANLDNLGVGIAYGISRRHISTRSNLVIAIFSGALTFAAMVVGQWVTHRIAVQVANNVGAIIIIGVGLWIYFESAIEPALRRFSHWLWLHLDRLWVRFLPEFVQAPLKQGREATPAPELTPVSDLSSGRFRFYRPRSISQRETVILGFSLALNAIASGFGASLAGHQAIIISTGIGIASYITIDLGQRASKIYFSKQLGTFAPKVAGVLLLLLGWYELFF